MPLSLPPTLPRKSPCPRSTLALAPPLAPDSGHGASRPSPYRPDPPPHFSMPRTHTRLHRVVSRQPPFVHQPQLAVDEPPLLQKYHIFRLHPVRHRPQVCSTRQDPSLRHISHHRLVRRAKSSSQDCMMTEDNCVPRALRAAVTACEYVRPAATYSYLSNPTVPLTLERITHSPAALAAHPPLWAVTGRNPSERKHPTHTPWEMSILASGAPRGRLTLASE